MANETQLTSTTAPGKVFSSRSELADHYKSDWHKYNLKRREAGLPLLSEDDFKARLEAALALRREREGREERTGTDHLKNKKKHKKKKKQDKGGSGVVVMKHANPIARKEYEAELTETANADADMDTEEGTSTTNTSDVDTQVTEEEPPSIEPRQCLFDKHTSSTLEANIDRMQRKYGFFIPDQEYLVDKEGLIGYCHEKIKLGHCCLYCQKVFRSWQGCQKHMISTRHTKLRYERGLDQEEFDPFYDFSAADAEFLGENKAENSAVEEAVDINAMDDDEDWEDVTDDEEEEVTVLEEEDEDDGLYAGYEDEIARFGFNVTPLGELVFPDGRIVGHRGLARYYKQQINTSRDGAAVVAARRAAGERLYHGRVYNIADDDETRQSALTLARAGVNPATARGRAGKGVLVSTGGGGYTALSLYRYRAVVKKARRDDARGQRLEYKSTQNMNRMDKKANRLMNGVSVAHAPR